MFFSILNQLFLLYYNIYWSLCVTYIFFFIWYIAFLLLLLEFSRDILIFSKCW